ADSDERAFCRGSYHSTHSSGSLPDEPFRETNNSRQREAATCSHKVTHPLAALIHAIANAGKVHDARADLQNAVERHDHVTNPTDDAHQCNPVKVRIVPRSLCGKCLECTKDSGSHQRK